MWCMGLVVPWLWDPRSPIRDWACVPCIARRFPALDHQEGPHGSLFVSLIAWIIAKKRRNLGGTAAPPFLALQLQAISAELRSPQSFRPFKLVSFTVSESLSPASGGWKPSIIPLSKFYFFFLWRAWGNPPWNICPGSLPFLSKNAL